jgi:hypothetical protein
MMSIGEPQGQGTGEEPDRWEDLVRRITAAAAFELARRRSEESVTLIFARWSRRLIPAAAVVAALSGTLLGVHGLGVAGQDETLPTLAEAMTPEPLALWFDATDEPTLVEMVSALEEVNR